MTPDLVLAIGLPVIGLLALTGFAYVVILWRQSRRERRRRRAGETRLAVDIYQPFCRAPFARAMPDATPLRILWHHVSGMVHDRPLVLPLAGAIALAGCIVLFGIDPIMDDAMLWGRAVPADWRVALPGWAKALWAGGVILGALSMVLLVFVRMPQVLSRQWLVLHADGTMTATGAAFPKLDPASRFTARRVIWDQAGTPIDHGAIITQDGAEIAFVIRPVPQTARLNRLPKRLLVPMSAHAVVLGLDTAALDAHLARHFLRPQP